MGAVSRPAIAEVAERAGVSTATVSRVLSPSGHKVSARTRERVLLAARELDYAPSALAQALLKRTSRIVGVVVGDNTDPYFAEIIRGVEEVASAEGYVVMVVNTARRPEREVAFARLLRSYRADGLILAGGGLEDPAAVDELEGQVRALQRDGCVVVATTLHRLEVPRVRVDGEMGAALAVEHLLGLAHRRIGIVTGPLSVTVSHSRLAGCRRALAGAGVLLEERLVAEGDFTRAGGEAAAGRLLELPARERPTAIFASNDMMAMGALGAARRRGLRVPEDVSVVGMDDVPLADSVFPALTTVHQPLRELGETAMGMVLAAIRGEETETERVLAPRLVVRESTSAPGWAASR